MVKISKSTLAFLSDLERNNNREWFNSNRPRYDGAKANYGDFIQAMIDEIVKFDPILKGLEARTCMFRINRDIRFSADKTIYKTHMGAFIVKGGKNNGDRYAGYYVHVEPGGRSMVAGGAYVPPMPWLTALREKIDRESSKFLKIINNSELKAFFGGIEGEKLKSAPKGFDKDHPMIEFLKMKSYLVSKEITDREITGDRAFDLILRGCRIMKPLNDFLNDY